MKIRLAIPSDAEAIGSIRVAAWQGAYTELLPPDFLVNLNPMANITQLREKLVIQSDKFTVLVAETHQLCTGFAILGSPRYETELGVIYAAI